MRLTLESGRERGRTVELDGRRLVIGRGGDCDLVLDDDNVSRRHAALERLPDGRVRLTDLHSTNGTWVDGRRIDGPLDLAGDEQLRIGDTVISLQAPVNETVVAQVAVPLTVVAGPRAGITVELAGDRFVLGRAGEADLVLEDPKVSGRHAALAVLPDGRVTVADLGSRNGTWIDGARIEGTVTLAPGAELRVGDTVLALGSGAPSPPPPPAAPAAPPATLRVESGERAGIEVAIAAERFLLGRGPGSDLVLTDHEVSRQHAILTLRPEGGAIVADLGSRNGTFVNGEAVDATGVLRSGDRLALGTVELTYSDTSGDATRPPAALPAGLSVARTPPTGSTEALAVWCSRRPWTTIALWVLGLAAAVFVVISLFADALTSEGQVAGNPESERGNVLLEQRLRGPRRINETVIVSSSRLTVDDQAFGDRVSAITDEARGLGRGAVLGATNFYDSGDESLVSRDRRTTLIPVRMAGDFDQAADNVPRLVDIVRRADRDPAFQVLISGEASVDADFEHLSEEDLKTGEVYGLGVAMVVLVFVFRALVSAVVPLVLALISIGVALGLTALVGQVFNLSFFVTNMVVGMGLALGIDYSLFVLTRYREEREGGRPPAHAIAAAGGTAGRAVLFSGLAVVFALVGMLFVPDTVLRSLGVGAILVGLVSVLAALTILPAVLGLLGDRVNALSLPRRRTRGEGSFWGQVARVVMRRPLVSLVTATALLVAASVPVLDLSTGSSGVSTLPDDLISKQGFVVLDRKFDAGRASPAEVVIDGPVTSAPVRRGIDRLRARLARDRDFGRPAPAQLNRRRDLALVAVPLSVDVESKRAFAAVRRLRSDYVPAAFRGSGATVLVTGQTAFAVDEADATTNAAPFVFAFVLGLSVVLLTLAFRSIVVPIKAIVMNLLSVGAAYGLLVLVFQKGHGADFFGFTQVDAVESWVPLFLFSVLFGLSMDYHVFLLSRIRERFNETGDNRLAVESGVTTTARLITGAALIMVAVFSGFAAGDLVMFQQMGFGLAVALLLDATIVRSVLVPATMTLLGKRNWYLPRWLRWLPEVGVEGQGR